MQVRLPGTKAGILMGVQVPQSFSKYTQRKARLYGLFLRWVFIGVTIYQKEEA